MKNILFFLLFIFMVNEACSQKVDHRENEYPSDDEVVYTEQDVAIFADIMEKFESKKDSSIGTLIPDIGKYFLGNEYVAHTLEVTDEEKLIINLRELDCTTYAENLLALARTLKSENANFQQFTKEIESIRYRDGKRGDYPTRLHYFSDWIYNNRDINLVETPTDSFGKPFQNQINFMSTHTGSYKHLKNNPDFVSVIANQEEEISSGNYFYLPKNEIAANEHLLKEGDIVGITTNIDGLDVAHVGVLVKQDGRMHLMHASQSKLKVEISEKPIADYLKPNSTHTGIMIARPVQPNSKQTSSKMLKWPDIINLTKNGNPEPDRRVEKTDEEWKEILDPEVYKITRLKGTEAPGSSEMCYRFDPGLYACAACGTELFDASTKFESSSGWPSFNQPVKNNVVKYESDNSFGMVRIEALCNVCDSHLGHVFPDGPEPSGLRYCINAASLEKVEETAKS